MTAYRRSEGPKAGDLGVPDRALVIIGSGNKPSLHALDYAFPDAPIPMGAELVERTGRLAFGDQRP